MRVFVDTNVFIASITDEPKRGEEATDFLNEPYEFVTSVLNLMELRTVLAKKKNVDQPLVETIIDDIRGTIAIYQPDEEDVLGAYDRQKETLLYPLDCLFLSMAGFVEATPVSFDRELLANGAIEPADVADS